MTYRLKSIRLKTYRLIIDFIIDNPLKCVQGKTRTESMGLFSGQGSQDQVKEGDTV